MTQRASSSRFPYISIRIDFREEPYQLELEAFIDTGFDGELILPMALAADLPPSKRITTWRMADGSPIRTPHYPITVQVLGLSGNFEANASLLGDLTMIGRLITNRFRINLDHGREVVVEP